MSSEKTTRTINGKSFAEVLNAIKQPFPYLVQDMAGHYALDEEQVYNRLDEVCGLNWSFVFTQQPKIETIGEKKHTVNCSGLIEILDDDGQLVCRRGQSGGSDVIVIKDTTNPKDLSNDYKSAGTDCFKKCAKSYGIRPVLVPGGNVYKNTEEAAKDINKASTANAPKHPEKGKGTGNNTSGSADKGPSNETGNNNSAGGKESTPTSSDMQFKVTKQCVRDNKKVKFAVLTSKGEPGELVFWNSIQNKIDSGIMQKINNAEPGMLITADIKEGEAYRGKRQFFVEKVLNIA